MTIAKKKSEQNSWKKKHKNDCGEKIWAKQCKIKKNVRYKNDSCQKIGTKQLKKNGALKKTVAEKTLSQTA